MEWDTVKDAREEADSKLIKKLFAFFLSLFSFGILFICICKAWKRGDNFEREREALLLRKLHMNCVCGSPNVKIQI